MDDVLPGNVRHADAVEQDQWATVTLILVVPAKLVVGTENATTAIWRGDFLFHFFSTDFSANKQNS